MIHGSEYQVDSKSVGHRLSPMIRRLHLAFVIIGTLCILGIALITSIYFYQYDSVIRASNQRIDDWKKSDWRASKNFDTLQKALVAAEDPSFLNQPKLDCGLGSLIKALMQQDMSSNCSSIISHAARLATSEIYVRPSRRQFAQLSMQQALSAQPSESLDIIFNRTYMGAARDGKLIEGFQQAAQYYFGKSLDEIKVSEAALLAGMVQSPQRYAPDKNPDLAKQRRDLVIDRMLQSTFISASDAASAKQEALQ